MNESLIKNYIKKRVNKKIIDIVSIDNLGHIIEVTYETKRDRRNVAIREEELNIFKDSYYE